jgi:hypothetical protein
MYEFRTVLLSNLYLVGSYERIFYLYRWGGYLERNLSEPFSAVFQQLTTPNTIAAYKRSLEATSNNLKK